MKYILLSTAAALSLMAGQSVLAEPLDGGDAASDVSVIKFETGSTITVTAQNMRDTEQDLQIAENALRAHIRRSVDFVAQGHRLGFKHFREWYRARDARIKKELATQKMIADLCGTALSGGLNYILPGSGVFTTYLKKGLELAYAQASKSAQGAAASMTAGDVNQFLDIQDKEVEAIITNVMSHGEGFKDNHKEDFDSLKWDFIMSRDPDTPTSTAIPDYTLKYLKEMGVPEPNKKTMNKVALRILERQIRAVIEKDKMLIRGINLTSRHSTGWELTRNSRLRAHRQFYKGHPEKYCPVEINLYGSSGMMGAGRECRFWASIK